MVQLPPAHLTTLYIGFSGFDTLVLWAVRAALLGFVAWYVKDDGCVVVPAMDICTGRSLVIKVTRMTLWSTTGVVSYN